MNPTWLYTAAVYALAVWLARRNGVALRVRIAAFFYALVLVFLFRPMTQAYVNVPADITDTLPPWSHRVRHPVMSNSELSDVTLQILPWAEQAREQWRSFRLPLWNERAGSGYPLLANGQSAALSPLRLITIPLSLGNAFTAEAALKLLIALTFMFLFCRRRGYSELASAIGAVSFGFCGFLHVWLHFPLVTVAADLPAAMYAVDLLAGRVTWRRFVFAASVWAVMIFGGHPETVSHISFLAALYLFWLVLVSRSSDERDASLRVAAGPLAGRPAVSEPTTSPANTSARKTRTKIFAAPMLAAGAAVTVGALLAMPLLAPLAEAIPRSKRYQELKVQPNEIGYFSDHLSQIVLLSPNFFGHPPLERPRGTQTSPESNTGFAGVLALTAWVALAFRAIRERRLREPETFFVIATLLVVGVMLAWPGISDLFHLVFKLAANARLRLLFAWLLAVQAAAVIDLVQRGRSRMFLVALMIASGTFLYLIHAESFPRPADRDTAVLAILPSLAVLAVAALTPVVARRWREPLLMLLTALVIGELWSAVAGWNPTVEARLMYPRAPMIDALDRLRKTHPPNDPFRVVGLGAVFFPNLAGVYGHEDIRAHDPMANGRYLGMLRVRDDYDPSRYFAKWTSMDSRTLDFLNVRYVLTEPRHQPADPERYAMVYDGKDGRIFENHDVLPRFFPVRNVVLEFKRDDFVQRLVEHDDWSNTALVGGKLRVSSDRERRDLLAPRPAGAPDAALTIETAEPTDYRLQIHAPRYTMIVSSIPMWPGWKVVANGRTLRNVEVSGAFLGFVVPPGDSDVEVRYAPTSFRAGVLVSLITLALLWALPIWWRRKAASRHP